MAREHILVDDVDVADDLALRVSVDGQAEQRERFLDGFAFEASERRHRLGRGGSRRGGEHDSGGDDPDRARGTCRERVRPPHGARPVRMVVALVACGVEAQVVALPEGRQLPSGMPMSARAAAALVLATFLIPRHSASIEGARWISATPNHALSTERGCPPNRVKPGRASANLCDREGPLSAPRTGLPPCAASSAPRNVRTPRGAPPVVGRLLVQPHADEARSAVRGKHIQRRRRGGAPPRASSPKVHEMHNRGDGRAAVSGGKVSSRQA